MDAAMVTNQERWDEIRNGAADVHASTCAAHHEYSWGYEYTASDCDCTVPAVVVGLVEHLAAARAELERVKEALTPFWCDNSAGYIAEQAAAHLADCPGAPNE